MKRILLSIMLAASAAAHGQNKEIFRDSIVSDSLGRPIEKIWLDSKGKIDLIIKFEYRGGKIFYRRYYNRKGKLISTVIGETED